MIALTEDGHQWAISPNCDFQMVKMTLNMNESEVFGVHITSDKAIAQP